MTPYKSMRYFYKSFRLYWREYVQFRRLWRKHPEELQRLTAKGKKLPNRISYAYTNAVIRFKKRSEFKQYL